MGKDVISNHAGSVWDERFWQVSGRKTIHFFCAQKNLKIATKLSDVFSHSEQQVNYEVNIRDAPRQFKNFFYFLMSQPVLGGFCFIFWIIYLFFSILLHVLWYSINFMESFNIGELTRSCCSKHLRSLTLPAICCTVSISFLFSFFFSALAKHVLYFVSK